MKKIKIKWEETDVLVAKLAKKIRPISFQIKNIYGLSRGGLVIASILSHKLGIPIILDKKRITRNTLIVDNVVDTGKTLTKVLKDSKPLATAVLHYNKQSKIIPTYHVATKGEDYIIYPWETVKTHRIDRVI